MKKRVILVCVQIALFLVSCGESKEELIIVKSEPCEEQVSIDELYVQSRALRDSMLYIDLGDSLSKKYNKEFDLITEYFLKFSALFDIHPDSLCLHAPLDRVNFEIENYNSLIDSLLNSSTNVQRLDKYNDCNDYISNTALLEKVLQNDIEFHKEYIESTSGFPKIPYDHPIRKRISEMKNE